MWKLCGLPPNPLCPCLRPPGEEPLAGQGSVVQPPDGRDGGGHASGEGLGGLSVVLGSGPEQGQDVLQRAGRLEAQRVHHVAQVLWRETSPVSTSLPSQRWELWERFHNMGSSCERNLTTLK